MARKHVGRALVIGLVMLLFGMALIPCSTDADDKAKPNPTPEKINPENKNVGAVTAGLIWLGKHQQPDGSWSAKSFYTLCREDKCSGAGDEQFDIGLTGLALLAFTGDGYTDKSTKHIYEGVCFGEVVKKAAAYLSAIQLSDGSFGGVKGGKFMYNQAIANYALADLYELVKSRPDSAALGKTVQKGIGYLLSAQNQGSAWRYQPKDGQSDSSVTGWMALALKAAEKSGIPVPPQAFNGIKAFYDKVTDPNYGNVGYTTMGSIALMSHEDPRKTVIQPTMTAIGSTVRLFIDKDNSLIKLGVDRIMSNLPAWDTSKPGIIDYYYWFYASACMKRYLIGRDSAAWGKWEPLVSKILVENQRGKKDGCACGSWDPIDRWSAEGSRVYCTAINVLTLETYSRTGK